MLWKKTETKVESNISLNARLCRTLVLWVGGVAIAPVRTRRERLPDGRVVAHPGDDAGHAAVAVGVGVVVGGGVQEDLDPVAAAGDEDVWNGVLQADKILVERNETINTSLMEIKMT